MIAPPDRQSASRDIASQLEALSEDFPDWVFLVSGHRWIAVSGKTVTVTGSSAASLRTFLREAPIR
jgi:hypothetical protein